MAMFSIFTGALDSNSSPGASKAVTLQLGRLPSTLCAFDGCMIFPHVATPCYSIHFLATGSKVPSMFPFTGNQTVVYMCMHASH